MEAQAAQNPGVNEVVKTSRSNGEQNHHFDSKIIIKIVLKMSMQNGVEINWMIVAMYKNI